MSATKSEIRNEKRDTPRVRRRRTHFLFSLFYFLAAASAAATTVTGTIKRPDGTLVNGTIEFVLSQQAKTTTPPILFAPVRTTCAVTDGVIAAGCTVQGNDTLDPAGTYYTVRVLDANNLVIVPAANYTIAGASVDLGTLPITATATLVPPSGTVAGNLSVTGNLTVGGSADFQGDPDDFSHFRLLGLTADPATATDGSMFHRSDLNRLRLHVRGLQLFDGTQYVDITSVEPNTVEFGGNVKVSGGTTLGTTADLKCGSTPPQPDGNSLRVYCPNTDEKLYFKDDTNTVLGPLAVLNSAQTWTSPQDFQEANNVVYANAQTGADAGAKVQACINTLPATGGTCDARGLEGAQTSSAQIAISKPVTLLLGAATYTFTNTSSASSGIEVLSSGVKIIGHGTVLQATQNLSASGINYFLVRINDSSQQVSNVEVRGLDMQMTLTGTTADAITVGCLNVRGTSSGNGVFDFRLLDNLCKTTGPDITPNQKWFGFYINGQVGGGTTRNVRHGLLKGNIFKDCSGRSLEVFETAEIIIADNQVLNANPDITQGGAGIRLIGTDDTTVVGNLVTLEANGKAVGYYVGANAGVAGDESLNVVLNANVFHSRANLSASGLYGLRVIGTKNLVVSNNTFLNDDTNGAQYGILISDVAANSNDDVFITGNRIKGFWGYQIRLDPGTVRAVIGPNYIGQTAAGANNFIDDQATSTRYVGFEHNSTSLKLNTDFLPAATGQDLGSATAHWDVFAGALRWNAATSFAGILSHANTADRTYTFPDASTALAGLGVANLFTASGALTLDNQLGLRLREQSANGTDYIELRAPASVTAPVTYTWNVQGDCTGNVNAGALTVNASKEIICSDDDGGGGGGGDNLSVNATGATDANFSDTAPAAPGSGVNVEWQLDTAATPDNISAYVQDATASQGGIVTTSSQSFAGQKTFTGGLIARDNNTEFQDDADTTKKLSLQLSAIAAATTRTWTAPNASGEVSLLGQTIEDAELASNYSGIGSCTNQFVRAANDNAAPTCATVTSSDLDTSVASRTGAQTLQNKTLDNTNSFSGYTDWTEVAAPASPAAGNVRLYAKTGTGELCSKSSGGAEICMSSGSGGSGDSVSVNGTAAADADFDDSTPAAPANSANVRWQKDVSAPNNISAHLRFADFSSATLGSGAGFTWTFDASAGTDTALTFSDNTADFSGQLGVSTSVGATLSDRSNLHAAGVTVTSGTTTNAYGLRVLSHTESGGVITNAYGARIKDQTVGANNWSVFAGPDLSAYKASLQSSMQNSASVFGSLNSSADAQVALLGVHEDNTTTSTWGSYGIAEARHTSGTKSALIAIEGDAIVSAAGGVTRATGIEGEAYTSGGGAINRLLGVAGYAEQSGTGTTTDMAALVAYTNTRSGGTVTNNYGLLIEDQSGIGTNNWALRTLGSALAQFGGAVDSASGYRVAGAAASGNYLRGDGTNFVSSAIQGADIASLTSTFTNKTLDAEATGNSLTTVSKEILLAAGCNNTTAAPGWDLPTSNAPAAACYGTSPQRFGALDFADGASALTSTTHLHLPTDWTGALDVSFAWLSGSTSTNSVVWTLATACVADSEDLLSPTFNSTQTVADANNATANTRNSAALSSITTTGCAAGETMFLRIGRDPTHASDTLAATTSLLELEITIRRAQ